MIAGAVALAVVIGLAMAPERQDASHLGRGILAAVGIGLVAVRLWLVRTPRAEVWLRAALAGVVTFGWFNYFQFDRDVLTGINDYTDTAYYYTNSKYLGELGYDGLYVGALLCDQERGSPRTAGVQQIRDLRDDELINQGNGFPARAFEHGRQVKANFTPARWQQFCHDIDYFLDRLSKRSLETNFFVDHGYNPPPTWSIVGGNLARIVPVEHLKLICMADAVLVAVMFVVLGWAFGLETMLWVSLFYVTTFSGRWPLLGAAIMRFDWVVALAIGMALLRVQRYGAAGVALAYAAMNRVFPAIFFWGWLVEAVLDSWPERRVPRKHLALAGAAALTTAVMVGMAAVSTAAAAARHVGPPPQDAQRELQLAPVWPRHSSPSTGARDERDQIRAFRLPRVPLHGGASSSSAR
ncbi:MAG: hypothetical protein R3F59_09730 [Myxococcota bacterium]